MGQLIIDKVRYFSKEVRGLSIAPLLVRLVSRHRVRRVRSRPGFNRCPNPLGAEAEIEIRQVFEAEDFGPEFTPELREQEERLRAKIAAKP